MPTSVVRTLRGFRTSRDGVRRAKPVGPHAIQPPAARANTRANKSALDRFRKSDASKVKVAITDIDGVLRGKYLTRDKFLSIAESQFGMCDVVFGWDAADVCYDHAGFTGWH